MKGVKFVFIMLLVLLVGCSSYNTEENIPTDEESQEFACNKTDKYKEAYKTVQKKGNDWMSMSDRERFMAIMKGLYVRSCDRKLEGLIDDTELVDPLVLLEQVNKAYNDEIVRTFSIEEVINVKVEDIVKQQTREELIEEYEEGDPAYLDTE
mgnify:CR=1 FL=1